MFNLENKITWKELAPSLQAMFKTLQSQITDVKNEVNNINISLGDINESINQINQTIENNYNELKGDITNIEGDITNIEGDISNIENNIEEVTNITNNITGIIASGNIGQLITIGKDNTLVSDNNFRILRVVDNDNDFNIEKKNVVSTKEIFDSWGRYNSFDSAQCIKYCHNVDDKFPHNNGQNNPDNGDRYSDSFWKYNEGTNTIHMPSNFNTYDIFVSNDKYSNYTIDVFYDRLDIIDDDAICIVLGYEQLEDNKYNYIILNRTNCYQNGLKGAQSLCKRGTYWSIIFNMFTDNMFIMSDHSNMLYSETNPDCIANHAARYNKIKIIKNGRSFECITTDNSKDENNLPYLESTKFTYTISSTKPGSWTDYQWNSINKMVSEPTQIGVGVQSQPCNFKILNSELISNNIIYRLDENKVYVYDNGWKVDGRKISDDIPPHSWVYNDKFSKLFHYDGSEGYTYINHNSN